MAVELKSGAGSDLGTIDPTSKALRVTQYNPNGSVVDTKTPVALTINPVTVVNNDIFASVDVSAYKYISLQLTGTWVGTVRFQGSNNNGTFEDLVVQNTGVVLEPYVISMTANGGVKIPVLFKFLRIRVTAYTSGSVTGTAFGYQEDANTGQISTVGTINISAAQTLATVTNVQQLGGQNVAMGGGTVSAGTQRVTVATDTPVVLGTGSATIGSFDNLQKLSGVDIAMGAGVTSAGTQRVVLSSDSPVSLAASANFIGKVSIASGSTLIPLFILGAAGAVNVNSASVVASAAILRAIVFTNYAATSRHFKLYNTSSVPAAGVGTPVLVCSMAAAGTLAFPLPVEGFPFSNGIGYTMTLGAANNDVTPTATAPDFSVSLIYSTP